MHSIDAFDRAFDREFDRVFDRKFDREFVLRSCLDHSIKEA